MDARVVSFVSDKITANSRKRYHENFSSGMAQKSPSRGPWRGGRGEGSDLDRPDVTKARIPGAIVTVAIITKARIRRVMKERNPELCPDEELDRH